MPCFHSMPRGMTGHAFIPSRSGFTACQMSMYGCPTTSTVSPHGFTAASREPGLLAALDQVVDKHADLPALLGLEHLQHLVEVVDALEVLDRDALDAEVVAPDLLDEVRVVAALDEDPAAAGDARLRAPRRRRSRRRLRSGPDCFDGIFGTRRATAWPSIRNPGPIGNTRTLPRRSSSRTMRPSTATTAPTKPLATLLHDHAAERLHHLPGRRLALPAVVGEHVRSVAVLVHADDGKRAVAGDRAEGSRVGTPRPRSDAQGVTMAHIGTSGWSYDHWEGLLYPEGARLAATAARVRRLLPDRGGARRVPAPAPARGLHRVAARHPRGVPSCPCSTRADPRRAAG